MTLIRFALFLLLILLSGCQSLVPATTPPQLSHTPGAPITITDNHIDAGWFSLDYPDGWRVVTNVAIEPLHLTLVSPDDEMLIYVTDARVACVYPEVTPDPAYYHRDECVGARGAELYIWGRPPVEFQDIYAPIFDALVNSVRFN